MSDVPLMIFSFLLSVISGMAAIALAAMVILGGFGVTEQDFIVVAMLSILMAVVTKAASLREVDEPY